MTVCARRTAMCEGETAGHTSFTIAADGSYAARLSTRRGTGAWHPERWTLDGPEPYAVQLPGSQPEDPRSTVLPLADGRVLIARPGAGRHRFALLYPTGPGTGELPLGTIPGSRVRLLPPAPCGRRAYALVPGEFSTSVWLVAGGTKGSPELVADVAGHCSGGAWLDREGRLLALDRKDPPGQSGASPFTRRVESPVKTVAVDLARGGETTPLLEITEESNDRLLLADPESALLLVSSDAPGEERIGWGVLGSHRPIRFPEALHLGNATLTPFAVQPGQPLMPEGCGVAFQVDVPADRREAVPGSMEENLAGREGDEHAPWLAVWRSTERELRHIAPPDGWLTGKGLWTEEGELRLPCATSTSPCALARLRTPEDEAESLELSTPPTAHPGRAPSGVGLHVDLAPRDRAPSEPDSDGRGGAPSESEPGAEPAAPAPVPMAAASTAAGAVAAYMRSSRALRFATATHLVLPSPATRSPAEGTAEPAEGHGLEAPAAEEPATERPEEITPVQRLREAHEAAPPAGPPLAAENTGKFRPVPLQQAPLTTNSS